MVSFRFVCLSLKIIRSLPIGFPKVFIESLFEILRDADFALLFIPLLVGFQLSISYVLETRLLVTQSSNQALVPSFGLIFEYLTFY